MTSRKLKENETQLNVILDKRLHAQFKSKTALNQKSMLGTLVDFIREYVEADNLPAEKITFGKES